MQDWMVKYFMNFRKQRCNVIVLFVEFHRVGKIVIGIIYIFQKQTFLFQFYYKCNLSSKNLLPYLTKLKTKRVLKFKIVYHR